MKWGSNDNMKLISFHVPSIEKFIVDNLKFVIGNDVNWGEKHPNDYEYALMVFTPNSNYDCVDNNRKPYKISLTISDIFQHHEDKYNKINVKARFNTSKESLYIPYFDDYYYIKATFTLYFWNDKSSYYAYLDKQNSFANAMYMDKENDSYYDSKIFIDVNINSCSFVKPTLEFSYVSIWRETNDHSYINPNGINRLDHYFDGKGNFYYTQHHFPFNIVDWIYRNNINVNYWGDITSDDDLMAFKMKFGG